MKPHLNIKRGLRTVLGGLAVLLCVVTVNFWVSDRADFTVPVFTLPLLLLLIVIPTLYAIDGVRRSKRQRAMPGFCPNCGYDLRVMPDRCPECGTVPKLVNK